MKAGHDNLLKVGKILSVIVGLINMAGRMGEVRFLGSIGTRLVNRILVRARAAMCENRKCHIEQMMTKTIGFGRKWTAGISRQQDPRSIPLRGWSLHRHEFDCEGLAGTPTIDNTVGMNKGYNLVRPKHRFHRNCPTCVSMSRLPPTRTWPSCHPFQVKVRNARSKQSWIGCRSWHAFFISTPYLCYCRGRVWVSSLDLKKNMLPCFPHHPKQTEPSTQIFCQ